MTDLDLAELRRIAEAHRASGNTIAWGVAAPSPQESLALLDRIEALEAELDDQQRRSKRTLAFADACADRAEARLARVTDDSMQATLQRALHRRFCDAPDEICAEDAGEAGEWWAECGVALDTIRAVAADEQEAER